jgi:hypothetical protein
VSSQSGVHSPNQSPKVIVWFHAETHWSKYRFDSRRLDSEDALWLEAPAKEQFALISDHRFHWRLLSLQERLPGFTGATALDIRQDCRPGKRSLSASGSAASAEAVASFCL